MGRAPMVGQHAVMQWQAKTVHLRRKAAHSELNATRYRELAEKARVERAALKISHPPKHALDKPVSAVETLRLIHTGVRSCVDTVKSCLARIDESNGEARCVRCYTSTKAP